MAAEQMAKAEEKGGDEWTTDKKAEMEADMTGKLLMAGWRGTKLEVNSVLRDVCDKVLLDKSVPTTKRILGAQALIMMGSIFRSTQRDDDEKDVHVFEELMAASQSKKKQRRQRPRK